MKLFKKVGSAINSRAFAYTSFVLSVCAAVFLSSATWTYGWIADLYPLGDKFVPTLRGVICACAAVNLIHLLIRAFAGDKKDSLCPAQRSGRSYGFPSGLRQAYGRPEFRHRRHRRHAQQICNRLVKPKAGGNLSRLLFIYAKSRGLPPLSR